MHFCGLRARVFGLGFEIEIKVCELGFGGCGLGIRVWWLGFGNQGY